jgi:methionyl aminopeptidase
LTFMEINFRTLPFAERWLLQSPMKSMYKEAFREIRASHCVTGYPIFIEVSGKPVTQAEHTLLLTTNGCEVIT